MTVAMFEYRRLRAPRENGAMLVEPPLAGVGEILVDNQRRAAGCDYDFQGRTLRQLAGEAREELVRKALKYTRTYRDAPEASAAQPIFLTGHQPQMFHPGVWFKNFVLGRLAEKHQGVGVNLLIDNDTLSDASLRVPGGNPRAPAVHAVALDAAGDDVPYEERRIVDAAKFAGFADRAAAHLRPLVPDPMLPKYWSLVMRRAAETDNLGQCIAQGRHLLEEQWGLRTLELPQSQVCDTPAFYWFVSHVLARLPRFWDVYNTSLAEFRRVNRVRSAAHPTPNLASSDGYLEAPFWIWRTDAPRRRRLFAKQTGDELVLTDRAGFSTRLPLSADSLAGAAVERLAALRARGCKIRTRALTTTLWARLALGDLFLHGIGGAKYDQLTDILMERFFGISPPAFLTLSATLLLPIEREPVQGGEIQEIDLLLRNLTFRPEEHIDLASASLQERASLRQWMAEKARWITADGTGNDARRRYLAIRDANAALQGAVEPQREKLLRDREEMLGKLRARRVLASREYAFCLYPERTLRSFLLEIPPNTS